MRYAVVVLCLLAGCASLPPSAPPLTPPEHLLAAAGFHFDFDTPPAVEPRIDHLFVLAKGLGPSNCDNAMNIQAQVFANSGNIGNAWRRMVGCVPSEYVSSGSAQTDLSRLRSTSDGHLDNVHALRNQYGADTVTLISNSCDYCGVAYMAPTTVSAFAQVCAKCITSQFSETHEATGHLVGMAHDKANASYAPLPYAYGWRDAGKGTVMAYGSGRQKQFSNPTVNFIGTSTPSGKAGEADNARVLRERALMIAGFRPEMDDTTPQPPEGWPDNAITVVDDLTAAAVRGQIIQQIWGCPGLPTRVATATQANVSVSDLGVSSLPNVQRIDKLTIRTFNQSLHSWLIFPQTASGALSVVILGHNTTGQLAGTSTLLVTEALLRGNAVVLVPMPLGGTSTHDALGATAYTDFSPLQYFLDAPIVALNTYLATYPAPTQLVMMGVSGGGWTATVLAALDPRIQRSIQISGTYPLLLHQVPPTWPGVPDWEQLLPGLTLSTAQLDYLDLYLAGVSDGRHQIQIHNTADNCCFNGSGYTTYAPNLTALNARWTHAAVSRPGIHGIAESDVQALVGPHLGPVLVTPPVSFTKIVDDEDVGFTKAGPYWREFTARTAAYNSDDWSASPAYFSQPGTCSANGGTGLHTASWTATGVPDAPVKVQVSYIIDANRATNIPYEIVDGLGVVLWSGTVNQKLTPSGGAVIGQVKFHQLATVQTATGTLTVRNTDLANGCVNWDAARFSTN